MQCSCSIRRRRPRSQSPSHGGSVEALCRYLVGDGGLRLARCFDWRPETSWTIHRSSRNTVRMVSNSTRVAESLRSVPARRRIAAVCTLLLGAPSIRPIVRTRCAAGRERLAGFSRGCRRCAAPDRAVAARPGLMIPERVVMREARCRSRPITSKPRERTPSSLLQAVAEKSSCDDPRVKSGSAQSFSQQCSPTAGAGTDPAVAEKR